MGRQLNKDAHLLGLIDLALSEDIGPGDITSPPIFPARAQTVAKIVAKESLVVSGLEVAKLVFSRVDAACRFKPQVKDGTRAPRGKVIAKVTGPTRAILAGERTALNFLCHLSGIATMAAKYVNALEGTSCTLLDTRKTTPGMRLLEKIAVGHGGGANHRLGLYDAVMLKDNHIAAAGSIERAVAAVRKKTPRKVEIEVECTNLTQVREALAAKADIIMLDNMSTRSMTAAVKLIAGKAQTEASGRVTLRRLTAIASSGVDFISVGAITHSAPAADISMDL